MKIVFTGGGTGGHIYPGLAVADELKILAAGSEQTDLVKAGLEQEGLFQTRSPEIFWIGNRSGMDRKIVESFTGSDGSHTISCFYGIPSGKLRRYFSLRNILDLFKIFFGFIAAFFILLRLRPAVLFSKGGFVSVPPCLAAKLLGIPVYTHECDFTPGLATRINSRVAHTVLVSYKDTARYFSAGKNVVVTGNPVRPVFYSADAAAGRKFLGLPEQKSADEKPVLLVIGGSLGAHQINTLVEENLDWLCSRFIVVHQTGAHAADCAYKAADYHRYSFIYAEMPHVIAAADIVLSRAGANALWECAVLGKPMVLVPLCGSGTRGDQVDNAAYFSLNDAALSLVGADADAEHLKQALDVFSACETRSAYGNAARSLVGNDKPAQVIAGLLLKAGNE